MPLVVAVGGHETREWIRQTDDFAAKCRVNGSTVTALQPDYDNHYSILYTFANPVTALGAAVLKQMGLAG
jgi:arylformamidase